MDQSQTLFTFFCENKTKMSTIKEPMMFFRHLKDNDLISEELFEKLEDCEDSVYKVLLEIEKRGPSSVEKFWNRVNQTHILKSYIELSELIKRLPTIQSGSLGCNVSNGENPRIQKSKVGKNQETEYSSLNNQAGPSSQNTDRITTDNVSERVKTKKDIRDMTKHKKILPVTCGKEKGLLNRKKMRNGENAYIKHGSSWITPKKFEELGGKGSNKRWKTSILCHGTTLNTLIKRGILKMAKTKKKK